MIRCSLFGHDYRDQRGEKPAFAIWGSGMPVPGMVYKCRRCGKYA